MNGINFSFNVSDNASSTITEIRRKIDGLLSSAQEAANALDALSNAADLSKLASSLKSLSQLDGNGLKKVKDVFGELGKIDLSKLSGIDASSLKALSKIDFSNLKGLKDLAALAKTDLSNLNISKLDFSKLSGTDFTKATSSLREFVKTLKEEEDALTKAATSATALAASLAQIDASRSKGVSAMGGAKGGGKKKASGPVEVDDIMEGMEGDGMSAARASKIAEKLSAAMQKVSLAQTKSEKERIDAIKRGDEEEEAIYKAKIERLGKIAENIQKQRRNLAYSVQNGLDYDLPKAFDSRFMSRSLAGLDVRTSGELSRNLRSRLERRTGLQQGDIGEVERRQLRLELEIARATQRRAEMQQRSNIEAAKSYETLISKLVALKKAQQLDASGKLATTNTRFNQQVSLMKSEAAAEAAQHLRAQRLAQQEERKAAAMKKATQATNEASAASLRYGDATERASQASRKQSSLLSQLNGQLAMYFSTYAITNFARQLIVVGGEFEKQHIALQVLIGDIGKANMLYGQMKTLALQSPFTFQQLLRDSRQVAAFGIPNEELYDTTKRLADLSAGLGVSMDRLILAYGQVRTATVLRGQEMRQFTEAGVPLPDMLARIKTEQNLARGIEKVVSSRDIFGMVSKKEISFEDVEMAIKEMTSEGGRFYQMQEKMADTLAGKWARLADAWGLMIASISSSETTLGGFFKGLLDGVVKLLSVFQEFGTGLAAFGASVAAFKISRGVVNSNIGQAFLGQRILKWSPADLSKEAFTKNSELLRSQIMSGQRLSKLAIAQFTQQGLITKELERQLILTRQISAAEMRRIRSGRGSIDGVALSQRVGGSFGQGLMSILGGGPGIAMLGFSAAMGAYMQINENRARRAREIKSLEDSAGERSENLRQFKESNELPLVMEYVDKNGVKHSDPYDAAELKRLREEGVDISFNINLSEKEIGERIKAFQDNIKTNSVLYDTYIAREGAESDEEYLQRLSKIQNAQVQAQNFIKSNAAELRDALEDADPVWGEDVPTNILDYMKHLASFRENLRGHAWSNEWLDYVRKEIKAAGKDLAEFERKFASASKRMSQQEALWTAAPVETRSSGQGLLAGNSETGARNTLLSQAEDVAERLEAMMKSAGIEIGNETGDILFISMIESMMQDAGLDEDALLRFTMLVASKMTGDNTGLLQKVFSNYIVRSITGAFTSEQIEAALATAGQTGNIPQNFMDAMESSLGQLQAQNKGNAIGDTIGKMLEKGLSFDTALGFLRSAAKNAVSELQKSLLYEISKVEGSGNVQMIIKTHADVEQMANEVGKLRDETFKRIQAMQKMLNLNIPVNLSLQMGQDSISKVLGWLEKQKKDDSPFRNALIDSLSGAFKQLGATNEFERITNADITTDQARKQQDAAERARRKAEQAAEQARRKAEQARRKELQGYRYDLEEYNRLAKAWEDYREQGLSDEAAVAVVSSGPYKDVYDDLRKRYGKNWALSDRGGFFNQWKSYVSAFGRGNGSIINEDVQEAIRNAQARETDRLASDSLAKHKRTVEFLKEELSIEKERYKLYEKMAGFFGSGRRAAGMVYGRDGFVGTGAEGIYYTDANEFRLIKERVEAMSEFKEWIKRNAGEDFWSLLTHRDGATSDINSPMYISRQSSLWKGVTDARNALQEGFAKTIAQATEWTDGGRDYNRQRNTVRRQRDEALTFLDDAMRDLAEQLKRDAEARLRANPDDADANRAILALQNMSSENLGAASVVMALLGDDEKAGAIKSFIDAINKGADAKIAGISLQQMVYGDGAGGSVMLDSLDSMPTELATRLKGMLEQGLTLKGLSVEDTSKLLENLNAVLDNLRERNFLSSIGTMLAQTSFWRDVASNEERWNKKGETVVTPEEAARYGVAAGTYSRKDVTKMLARSSDNLGKVINKTAQAFDSVVKAVQPLVDILDNAGLGALGSALGTGTATLQGAQAGLQAGEDLAKMFGLDPAKFGPWGAAAGAGFSLLGHLFGSSERKRQEEIAKLNANVQKIASILSLMETVLQRKLGPIVGWNEADARLSVGTRDYDKYVNNYLLQKSGFFLFNARDAKIGNALVNGGYVEQQLALMEAQIADKQKAIDETIAGKNTNWTEVDKMEQELRELQIRFEYLREDLAQNRWGFSLKDSAQQFGDALVDSFARGEDAAYAFDTTTGNILTSLTKKMLSTSVIEPQMEKLRRKFFSETGYFGEKSEASSDLSDNEAAMLALDIMGLRGVISDSEKIFNAINDMSGGLMDAARGSSATGSIKGITEDTANLLASYINAIRADVSQIKEYGRQENAEIPVIARAQLQQLGAIARNTEENARAAEEILSVFQAVTNGTRKVSIE